MIRAVHQAERSVSEQSSQEHPLQVPRRTTPTWEIELLISGALVFSLFSLREPLENYFISVRPMATELVQPLIIYSYLYSKLVLFVLLITFVLHLAARARWVALVGVHSIYPQGPRWDNLSGGPMTKRLTRETVGDMDEAIEHADNQASLVFGYGILAAQLSLMILVVSLVFFGLLTLLRLLGVPQRGEYLIVGGFAAFLILPMLVDNYVLPRLRPDSWLQRATLFMLRISFGLSLHRLQQPLNSLVTTNFGGKRGTWVLVGVIYGVLGLASLDTFVRMEGLRGVRGAALGETERDFGLLPSHYARYRTGSLRFSASPFIDDEIVGGPYLRLSIPYRAHKHDEIFAERCPDQGAEPDETASTEQRANAERALLQARVTCFGRLFGVQLDGVPLPDLEFHRLQGPDDGLDGVMTFIDVRGLRNGPHALRLEHLDRSVLDEAGDSAAAGDGTLPPQATPSPPDEVGDSADAGDRAPPRPHIIEFWR